MKKILTVVAAFLAFTGVAMFSAIPESSAADTVCWNDYETLGGIIVTDNWESPSLAVRATVYWRTCDTGSSRIRAYRAVRVSYAGDGGDIWCGASQIKTITMNFGPIAGFNPPSWTSTCRAGGNTKLYDFADIRVSASTDRCAGTYVHVDQGIWGDIIANIPPICVLAPAYTGRFKP